MPGSGYAHPVRDGALRIGEVAEQSGVSRRTVDFYTRLGLLKPLGRTEGNYRLYEPGAVDQIRLIRRLERQGVSLEEIARARGRGPKRDLESELEAVDRKLHDLRKAVRGLPGVAHSESSGVLSALVERLQGLVQAALEVTGGVPPPI